MDVDQAKSIIADVSRDMSADNGVLHGLNLISETLPDFDTDTDFCAEHDQIFAAPFGESVALMSEEQIRQMAAWGWFEAEDSWSHFC